MSDVEALGDLRGRDRGRVELLERRVELERRGGRPDVRLELGAQVDSGTPSISPMTDIGSASASTEMTSTTPSHSVEQLVGQPHDLGAQLLDRLRRERLRHQPPQPGVVGRVQAEHRARLLGEVLEALAATAPRSGRTAPRSGPARPCRSAGRAAASGSRRSGRTTTKPIAVRKAGACSRIAA